MRNAALKTLTGSIFIFIACCLSSFSADDPKPDSKGIIGIWEMLVDNRPTGFLKILGPGGDLNNVRLTPVGFITTLRGSYEIQSDSTYVEKIEESEDPGLNRKNLTVRYNMDNANLLTITYTLNNYQGKETYRRVPFTVVLK